MQRKTLFAQKRDRALRERPLHLDPASSFPVAILRTPGLGSLEAVVKYLRERGISYKEIGTLLSRDPKTLAVTYANSKRKHSGLISAGEEGIRIPFSAFNDVQSPLESVCAYLKGTGFKNVEIARLVGKDPRTTWTVLSRSQRKLRGHIDE